MSKKKLLIGLLIVLFGYLLFGFSLPSKSGSGARDVEASETDENTFSVSGPVFLNFGKIAGSITINAGPPESATVTVIKYGRGGSRDEAASELKKLKAEVKQQGQILSFTTGYGNGGLFATAPPLNSFEYIIRVPEGTGLKIEGGNGDVTTKYLKGSMDITGQDLDLILNDVKGDLSIRAEKGSVRLLNVAGSINLAAGTATVSVERANGPEVTVSSSTNIFLKDTGADGLMKIETTTGDLSLNRTRAKNLQINAPKGKLNITDTTSDEALTISGGQGDVSINRGNFNPVQIETKDGQVAMKEVQGGLTIKTGTGDIDVRQSTVTALNVTTDSGEVLFGGKLPETGENMITTIKGGIQVFIPKESPFTLDATTSTGKITFNIPVTLDSQEKADNRLKGIANNGGSLLTLKSQNGDIRLSSRLPW